MAVKPHRSFDPRRVGGLECDAWVAYDRRAWLKFLRAAISLTRHAVALPWAETIRGAWLVLGANQLWAPFPDNDFQGAGGERWSRSTASSPPPRGDTRPRPPADVGR